MMFFAVFGGSKPDEASFWGYPSVKRRRKTIAHILKKLERIRQNESFFLRYTNESPLASEGFFDGDGHFKLPTDFIDCAIDDLNAFLHQL